jgi:hypothetical protein
MPDSSDIVAALLMKLGSDATLLSLCPNGVYQDEAPEGMTRFVIVYLIEGHDVATFGRRAIEDALYGVEARMLSTVPGANIKAAGARIDALLEDQPLTVAGYTWMALHRESPINHRERDEINRSILWLRRGGDYRVQMSVT